jgi:hypothetical protein
MKYKVNDLVKIIGNEDAFKVVMASETSLNLMLVKCGTNQLWSAHSEEVTPIKTEEV